MGAQVGVTDPAPGGILRAWGDSWKQNSGSGSLDPLDSGDTRAFTLLSEGDPERPRQEGQPSRLGEPSEVGSYLGRGTALLSASI